MPEYLAPGVFIEETSYRAKSIEGVSTSTAGFIGPTRFGPTTGEPELLTSFTEFERIYGGLDELDFGAGDETNDVAQAARAFFDNGGRRLYVVRVPGSGAARASLPLPATSPVVTLQARFPGRAGNLRVGFVERMSANLLVDSVAGSVTNYRVQRVRVNDTVYIANPSARGLFLVTTATTDTWVFEEAGGNTVTVTAGDDATSGTIVVGTTAITTEVVIGIVTVDVNIERPILRPMRPQLEFDSVEVLEGFSYHPDHPRALTAHFATTLASRTQDLTTPLAINAVPIGSGVAWAAYLFGSGGLAATLLSGAIPSSMPADRVLRRMTHTTLSGGTDGSRPGNTEYEGTDVDPKTGFRALEDIEDISIVAAPGISRDASPANAAVVQSLTGLLIRHCERMRYRVAVLDAVQGHSIADVRAFRGRFDSTHAALYYPWVVAVDPIREQPVALPPSGFVAGIYARNDVEHGVHKAPANEVVANAIRFEVPINKGQQEVLNPDGINAFRFFEGRGYRLWGARTISSDPEWKYVNVRRYFAYLERSIEKGTQWVVFENNAAPLWANVRRTIEDFLFNEWKSERLMGTKPEDAYFVRCDRTTMTQSDLDNGRLICLVGVAVIKPAEFVIFRIGQWTADSNA